MSRLCDCCRRCRLHDPSIGKTNELMPPDTMLRAIPPSMFGLLVDAAAAFDEISESDRYSAVEFIRWLELSASEPRMPYASGGVMRSHDISLLRHTRLG